MKNSGPIHPLPFGNFCDSTHLGQRRGGMTDVIGVQYCTALGERGGVAHASSKCIEGTTDLPRDLENDASQMA